MVVRKQAAVAFAIGCLSLTACGETETQSEIEAAAEQHGGGHTVLWGYEHDDGPDRWGAMKSEWRLCIEGLEQSPIEEMHLVHRADDGALAVVGVFVEEGAENSGIVPLWAALDDAPGTETRARSQSLRLSTTTTAARFRRSMPASCTWTRIPRLRSTDFKEGDTG